MKTGPISKPRPDIDRLFELVSNSCTQANVQVLLFRLSFRAGLRACDLAKLRSEASIPPKGPLARAAASSAGNQERN